MGGRRVSRRSFVGAVGAASAALGAGGQGAAVTAAPGYEGGLTDVPGLLVGHFTDARRPTGCTVVLAEAGALCAADVRGGAPGTRETALLDPLNMMDRVHAIVLAGGSAFGLDAATGVMRFLDEKGIGFPVGAARVPIVPAAILFDLAVGDGRIRPDAAAGHAAASAANAGPVVEGDVGAGAGASVGKLFGFERAMKAGVGSASWRGADGLVVAALVAVNAVGDVVDPASGQPIAGARGDDGKSLRGTMAALRAGLRPGASRLGEATTLAVVATNAKLPKAGLGRVALMAHDGFARTIAPVHTPWDGDTVFALSTGQLEIALPELVVGALAADVLARAIVRAARMSRGLPGLPSASVLALG